MTKPRILQGIDTIIIRVSDINNAKKWYLEKLQLNSIWEDEKLNLVVLDTQSATSITLWQTDDKIIVNKNTSSYPIFKTTNAQEAFQELQNKGVLVEQIIEDHFVKYFFFYDLDGNILETCEIHQ